MPTHEEAVAMLTAPVAPFEIEESDVRGLPRRNWKNRERSRREKVVVTEGKFDPEQVMRLIEREKVTTSRA